MSENIASTMPFAAAMGVEVTQASKEKIIGTLTVRPDLCTAGHILHGGAIMAFAAREGTTVTGTCEPLHVGKTTSVWQTHVNRGDGSLVAVITQTQLVR
jgi:acyl-coenzyme A thioesterase PaaI-like protein